MRKAAPQTTGTKRIQCHNPWAINEYTAHSAKNCERAGVRNDRARKRRARYELSAPARTRRASGNQASFTYVWRDFPFKPLSYHGIAPCSRFRIVVVALLNARGTLQSGATPPAPETADRATRLATRLLANSKTRKPPHVEKTSSRRPARSIWDMY